MNQNQIPALDKLHPENMENIFNVYQEADGLYYYNLLQTIAFPQDLPLNLFTSYNVTYGDTWPYISYKNYNTPNLWWIILLANNIQNPMTLVTNPSPTFTPPLNSIVPGSTIRIPIAVVVKDVLAQIGR